MVIVKRCFNIIRRHKRRIILVKMSLYFLKIVESVKATHSIEVGAFSAEFSKSVLKIYKYIYAFEANPYVFEKYKPTMPEQINYANLAISDKNEKINFYFKNYEKSIVGQSNSILEVVKNKYLPRSISVDSASLDSLFPDKPKNVIWIDVEGANREVLLGSINLLENTKALFIEVEHKEIWGSQWTSNDVYKFLLAKGFSLISINIQDSHQSNSIYLKNDELSTLQFLVCKPISYLKMRIYDTLSLNYSRI